MVAYAPMASRLRRPNSNKLGDLCGCRPLHGAARDGSYRSAGDPGGLDQSRKRTSIGVIACFNPPLNARIIDIIGPAAVFSQNRKSDVLDAKRSLSRKQ